MSAKNYPIMTQWHVPQTFRGFIWYWRDEFGSADNNFRNGIKTGAGGFLSLETKKEYYAGGLDWTDGNIQISWAKTRWDFGGVEVAPYRYDVFYAINVNTGIYRDKSEWISFANMGISGILQGACMKNTLVDDVLTDVLLVFFLNANQLDYRFLKKDGTLLGSGSLLNNISYMQQIVAVNHSCTKGATIAKKDNGNEAILDITINFSSFSCSQTNTEQFFSKTGAFNFDYSGNSVANASENIIWSYTDPSPVVCAIDFLTDTLEKFEIRYVVEGEYSASITPENYDEFISSGAEATYHLKVGRGYVSTSGAVNIGVYYTVDYSASVTPGYLYPASITANLDTRLFEPRIQNLDLRYGYIVYSTSGDKITHTYIWSGIDNPANTSIYVQEQAWKSFINDVEIPSRASITVSSLTRTPSYPFQSSIFDSIPEAPAVYCYPDTVYSVIQWSIVLGYAGNPHQNNPTATYSGSASILDFTPFQSVIYFGYKGNIFYNMFINNSTSRLRELGIRSDGYIKVDRFENAVLTAHIRNNSVNPATFNGWEIKAYGTNSALAESSIPPADLLGVI